MNSSKESVKRKPSPIHAANFFSKWFFIWTRGVFKKGYLEKLGPDDIYEHVPKLDSKLLSNSLISYWEKEVRRKNPSLLHMIFSAFGWRFVPMCIIYSMLEIMLHTFQPLFLGLFVAYFADGQTEITKKDAYLAATGIVICSLVASLCFHPFMFFLFKTGTAIRVACAGLIYRKCLRSSVTSDNSGMSGFAISVLSTDLPQFDTTFYFVHDLWKGPIEACVFGYVMYTEIGWPAIVGIAAIAIFIPLQAWAAKATARYRHRFSEYGDERVKLMNEIITAIQVIKMYAWEKSFARLISSVRKKEIRAIRGSLNIYSAMQCTNMISKFALFLSLIAYVYTGDVITARKVFIISSYYDALNESLLHFWPLSVTTWAETFVCARRIQTFLMQSEDPADGGIENFAADIEKSEKANFSGRVHNPNASEKSVILQNLSASWDREDVEKRRNHISDITFHIRPGQFVGIVGNVGAGKTTLLTAILGELEIAKGSMQVNGRISYAPQEAWIFEASIRDNICFVEPYDAQRYRDVVQACELERDLQLLPYGDSTIVGERGISLSGGQKARISLARAVYRQADIYIFDDPLSAVDARVAKRLLRNCFQDYLSTKIRLMVTHRVYNLKEADWIILLEAGTIEVQGTYEVLEQKISKRLSLTQEQVEKRPKLMHSESVMVKATAEEESERIELPSDTGLERKEQQMQGSVRFQIYAAYFRALRKPWLIFLIFLMFILARACQALMDVFIARWATWEESQPQEHETTNEFSTKRMQIVIIYTMLMLGTLLLYIVRTFGFFFICLAISLRLHDYLFNGIIRARMRFFNTNPSGRILNRFSSDIANIDITLPQTMLDSYSFYVNIIAVLAIVAFANYWLLIPEFIVISLLYFCRGLYIKASRSLKRIESMTRSPVYTHTNQTFQGLTTIRALNATSHLDNEFHSHQNTNTSALFLFVSVNRAFAFWTDLICVLYILAVTFSFLIIEKDFYSGDVGLAITQSMTLVIMCQWGVRQTAEMENNMTSVERVMEYVELPPEPPLETDPSLKLPETWPSSGEVQFRDLVLRYVEQGEPVLKGLNFSINSKEKIGIVGRTGAGKSSIIQAIFRLALNEGSIVIDGIDINTLGLHDLRSRISIIPQDPVLFSGTLRYNLDPLAEKADEELWRALEDVKLKRYVSSLEGGLNCRMHDGGSNFSMGQRQLVCMARAILRHNKLLIMDEATANVDPETDILIQQTIHTNFHHCTVLTIAHRLNTVMDNDKVIVVDAGQVVEFGHPYDLLRNTDGFLYKLVQNTGRLTSEMLHHIAEKSYKKRVANG